MPHDRAPRPVRSFLSRFFGPINNDTDRPHQLTAENLSISPAGHATPQPLATTITPRPGTSHERLVTSLPLQIVGSHDTAATNDLPPILPQNLPQSSVSNQNPRFPLAVQQHDEERHSIYQPLQPERNNLALPSTQPHISTPVTRQHTQPRPTESINQHYSVDPPRNAPYRPTLRNLQVENVPQHGAPLEQQCSTPRPPRPPFNQSSPRLQHTSSGLFNQAHNFVINDSVFLHGGSDNFMASFLTETIIGAEFDSSDPNMPLRCHPGTRSEIIKRCQDFILNRDGRPKLRWVVGAAGVGKSAIMQSVAHDESEVLSDIIVGATIFFSINGRQDGTKAITTIAYQLAAKLKPYRLFVQREITLDPSLLRKSLATQYKKFIVEPFIHQHILDRFSQVLIILDGLDECSDPLIQQELLGLISDFCITYPTSPIVWMIASRPEPHITSFFSQPRFALSYEKEEVLVDSDKACEDVKHYLRSKLKQVQMTSITLQHLSRWPAEDDLLKIARASGGLFAYASTVVRYISDPDYGDPVSLLDDVLEIIETGTKQNLWGRNHPMAQLDALYSHIMAKIPANVMVNTRKLLLLLLDEDWGKFGFQFQCNILGMTQSAGYGATHHIRSIAHVPGPAEAAKEYLDFFHKSFADYLRDFDRSGFSLNIDLDAAQLVRQCALRILGQAPNGVYGRKYSDFMTGGVFINRPGTGNNISVSWPVVEDQGNCVIRAGMYDKAVEVVMGGFESGEEAFQSLACMRVLTTCFARLPRYFPLDGIQEFIFDTSRRHKLLEHGILKQAPLHTLGPIAITAYHGIRLRFRGPTAKHSNPWNISCKHKREGSWEGRSQDWSTNFMEPAACDLGYTCSYCFDRFIHHFDTTSKGHLVTILDLTSTLRLVEFRFVDPNDGVSDWMYQFFTGEDDDQNYHTGE